MKERKIGQLSQVELEEKRDQKEKKLTRGIMGKMKRIDEIFQNSGWKGRFSACAKMGLQKEEENREKQVDVN